jgi:hypothetical protein
MANLIRNRWLWLALLGAALLFGLAAGERLPGPTMVHAAGSGQRIVQPSKRRNRGDRDLLHRLKPALAHAHLHLHGGSAGAGCHFNRGNRCVSP